MQPSRLTIVPALYLAATAALTLAPPWAASVVLLPLTQSAAMAKDVDMDAVPALTADGVKAVQQALQKKGFDPGPIDGILGPQTEQAVRKFQDAFGINASGRIDNQTLYALGQTQLVGEAKP